MNLELLLFSCFVFSELCPSPCHCLRLINILRFTSFIFQAINTDLISALVYVVSVPVPRVRLVYWELLLRD